MGYLMGKAVTSIIVVSLSMAFCLFACSTVSEGRRPEIKHLSRLLASGTAGGIVMGNLGGFIIGSFIVDTLTVATMEYKDIQLEEREEATRRVKYRQAEEKKKREQEKAEKGREEDRKAEETRQRNKKAEGRQSEEKKKAEESAQEDKTVGLFIENSDVIPQIVEYGSDVQASVKYTVIASDDEKRHLKIIEKRILVKGNTLTELARREVLRKQGTHLSTMKFTVNEEIPKGYCKLLTSISDGENTRTITSDLIIN